MTRLYVFQKQAEADLREITRYTLKKWGAEQARAYTSKLGQCIEALVKGTAPFKDLSELYPGLRMFLCQHHFIFCLPRTGAPALVVAILHERMEIMERLKLRLTFGLLP